MVPLPLKLETLFEGESIDLVIVDELSIINPTYCRIKISTPSNS